MFSNELNVGPPLLSAAYTGRSTHALICFDFYILKGKSFQTNLILGEGARTSAVYILEFVLFYNFKRKFIQSN